MSLQARTGNCVNSVLNDDGQLFREYPFQKMKTVFHTLLEIYLPKDEVQRW